ncbi:hypothetical protein A5844_000033 [Enterococcus sp. 10A9_DIV0425]|uniref:Uncharacterized protein n=2 Tax=Candidatus Enterococcus wittei TaxID=1987383 RepID=A0A2C9XNS6_9ENTE|nr:QWxxN domain [Enterococcus sp. 10A9_DIV0425]OTP11819.1 hypothetical protein A5844_000033 [Enterococcus sp. 10A9_DIV0425]
MPGKPGTQLKPAMTKKSGIPQAISREAIGKENNKRNDKNKSGKDQARLNYIANNIGQTLAPDSLLTLDGFLYLSSIFQNARLIDPPEQQPIIKKNAPAFEANTWIDVRRDGNQTRIHSFVSTSTINRERIQSLNTPRTMPQQSTSIASPFISAIPFFDNQTFRNQTTSTQEIIDVAKIAHELSISVHQKVHALYQLMNCTTTRRTDQVNTYIVAGESVEQTSLKTICQDAVGQEKTQNNQEMKQESEIRPFSTDTITDRTVQAPSHFSAEETAKRLSKTFQASFENKYNATRNPTNHVHIQVIETFWNDLTKLFYQFFSQHEHTDSTQEKKETSESLLTYFADWLLSSFSVNYGKQIPTSAQSEKNLNVQVSNRHTKNLLPTKTSQKKSKKKKQKKNQQELSSEMVPESVSKAKAVLLPEGESYLAPFWHLAEDFFGRVDGFIEHFNFAVFPYLGVEAAVIPSTDYEEMIVESYIEIPTETVAKIKRIMNAYLEHRPSSESNAVPLPSFWFDLETFQLRHKIQGVNQKVKDYLCKQGVPCDGLSGVKLLDAVKKWEVKDGLETKMARRKRIATIIRNALELQNIEMKYTKATRIVLQWRNNNIFRDYTFEELQQSIPKESKQTILDEPMTTEEITVKPQTSAMTSTTATKLTTESLPKIGTPQLQFAEFIPKETRLKLEKVVELYTQGSTYDNVLREMVPPNLPIFWYELEVFEHRDQLENVNKELKAFLCMKNQWCQDMTEQALFLKIRSWVESKEAQTARTRRKKIAEIIRKASGLQSRKLTNSEAKEIILQWRDNNIFRSYKFKEIHQIHAKTTASLNGNQSNVTTELSIETSSVKNQVEKTLPSITQSSNTSVKLSENAMKLNSIITAFFYGKPSPVPVSEKLPLFMDDAEVYKKRNETDYVNDKVKEFLCTKKEPCDGLSPLRLINTIYWWIWKEGQEKKITRSKEVAEVILSSYGLAKQEVSDDRASMIIQQWRNNNIFKGYQFEEPKQIRTQTTVSLNENPSNMTTELPLKASSVKPQVQKTSPLITQLSTIKTTTSLPTEEISKEPSLKSDATSTPMPKSIYEKVDLQSYETLSEDTISNIKQIMTKYLNRQSSTFSLTVSSTVSPTISLPSFWYDRGIFQERSKTQEVNKAVKAYLCRQEVPCDGLIGPELLKAVEDWEQKAEPVVRKLRRRLIARVIRRSYGLEDTFIFNKLATNIVLQWRNNNIFYDYTFEEQQQTTSKELVTIEETIVSSQQNETIQAMNLLPNKEISKRKSDSSFPIFIHISKEETLEAREEISEAMIEDIKQIMMEYMDNMPSTIPKTVTFPPFWDDYEIFQQRSKTEQVNEDVRDFLCDRGVQCGGLSGAKLIKALLDWEVKGGLSMKVSNRNTIAHLIRTSYGLIDLDYLSNTEATNIVLQWKNNNIFQEYTFTEEQPTTLKDPMTTIATTKITENQSSIESTSRLVDYSLNIENRNKTVEMKKLPVSDIPLMKSYKKLNSDDVTKINNIISNFMEDRSSSELTSEALPPFWYDFDLYQKRSETEKVNEAVKKIICEGKDSCSDMTIRGLLLASQSWLEGGGEETEILKRKQQIINSIIENSGLAGQHVSNARETNVILQWRDNNIFRNFKFKTVDQLSLITNPSRNETIIENPEIVGTTVHVLANSYGTIPQEAMTTMNYIREAFLDGRDSSIEMSVPLIPIWYDFELYQERGKTEKANEALLDYLCARESMCAEELSKQELVFTVNEWIKERGVDTEILKRKKEIIPTILEAYGITDRNITDTNAARSFLQWENNNAFYNYQWINLQQIRLEAGQSQNATSTGISEMQMVPATVVDPELIQVHTLVREIINDVIPLSVTQDPLPIFYYDYNLFQKRAKTIDVNKQLKEFLTKEGIGIKELSQSELAEGIREWIQKADPNEPFDKSGRRQYISYFLLKAYEVENIRLGEFMSYDKMNGILTQWKINSLLVGQSYKKITNETIHHYLRRTEHYLMTNFKQEKQVSDQIYADFIHDRSMSVPKNQPLLPIYVYFILFEKREKTPAVNEAVRKFLVDKGVSFNNQTTSELVRKLREWIFKGETYSAIVEREKEAARKIRKAYGLKDKSLPINKARNALLQWVNNNAQSGYTYKEIDEFEESQLNQRIKAFIRLNGDPRTQKKTEETVEEEITKLNAEQKLAKQKRIIAFLIENGVKPEDTTPDKLVKAASDWGMVKEGSRQTLDMVKIKNLAQVILGRPRGAFITEAKANIVVVDWLYETAASSMPQPQEEHQQTMTSTQPTTDTQSTVTKKKEKYRVIQWQNINIRGSIDHLFRQKNLINGKLTKEKLLIALGKWFTQEGIGVVLGHEQLKTLAKVILKELKIYGGEDETISDKDLELTVSKWVFEYVLGSPIEVYVLKKILTAPDPSQFTIGDLRMLFEVNELEKAGIIDLSMKGFSRDELTAFQAFWVILVSRTLPNYFIETSGLDDQLLISNYSSLMQLIGAKLLDDVGLRTEFDQEEIRIIGAMLLETFVNKDIENLQELRYVLIPTLLAMAQLEPTLLKKALEEGNYKEVAFQKFMGYWQKGYLQIAENQKIITDLFMPYRESTLKWRRKNALADAVVKGCVNRGAPEETAFILKQVYLGGLEPCPDRLRPPKLEDEFVKLTKAVSDTFYPFDQKLIEFAVNALDPADRTYIFSSETRTYEAHAKLKSHALRPGSGTAPPFHAAYLNKIKDIELAQCDLFVAKKDNEERWYALKRLESNGGYIFYRVDKDPLFYFKFGLFDQENLRGKSYKIEGNDINIGNRMYTFTIGMDQSKELSHGDERRKFIDTLSRKHSDTLYQHLYDSGNDKTIIGKMWDTIKHFIPFYDCVTGLIDRDFAGAAFSCIVDVVFLIPVLGQITALNTRFALGLAKAIATGGIRSGIRQGVRFLPKVAESKKVLYGVLRYFDPGFELVKGAGLLVVKGLVKITDQLRVSREVKIIIEKLAKLQIQKMPKEVVMARLSEDGPEVAVKLVKNHLYVRVTDLKTATVSGEYFVLKGDHLKPFSGAVTFTSEQLALIDRLAVKTNNPSQIIVTEPNVNPRAYGEGPVRTVAYGEGTDMKVDKEEAGAKYFVQMNQQLVPIRITAIEGHGVRFDVVEGEKIHPVNYNGIEWYFEAETSPFISKELVEEVGKKIDDFESIEDPTTLSPPYERDLMSNENGRTYIKINDHYIPLILFDKNNGRYHLVKKDIDEPMMVLRFDPYSDGFKMETLKEKEELKVLNHESLILRMGKVQSKWKSGSAAEMDTSAGTSQGLSIPSTSTGTIPKVFTRPADLPAIDFPALPDNWEKWKDLKTAEPLQNRITVEDNLNIDLTELSEFPPRLEVYYNMDEDLIRQNIYAEIDEFFPRPIPQLEVFTGLDSTGMPNYLKPFFEQLRDDFEAAERRFNAAVLLFKSLWKMEDISSMEEGKYLIEMFKLQGVPKAETEEILRESIRKLYSTAERGKAFLEQSKDLFFQNVWTLSSKLVYDREALSYYSSVQDFIKTQAFTVRYDGECRIFILADAFHLEPKVLPGAHLQPTGYETVMHEVTHIISSSEDLLEYGLVRRGLRKNGKRTLDYYDKKYPNMIKEDSEQLKHYRDYLAIVLGSPNLTVKMVSDALEVNHTLRVHFQLTDAEMLMTILRDLVEGRAFDAIFRAKRENDKEQDGKKSDSLETIKEQLGTGDLFALQALIYTSGFINFEREVQQSKTQEKTTDIPESISTKTTNSPTTGNRNKREIVSTTIESAESITNQSLLKLINQSIERSNYPNQFVSDQQVDTASQKNVTNRNSLNHVPTNTESNPNHFVSDLKISTGLPKDAEKKSFLDVVFTSRNRSTQNNSTKAFNPLINKNQKILAPQH